MSDQNTYPSVSDLAPPSILEGEYRKVSQLVGEAILVTRIETWHGKGQEGYPSGPGLVVNGVGEDGVQVFFIVSHTVLYEKFNWLRDKTPFVATIFTPEGARYYDVR